MISIARARLALEGLSVADAFGEQLLHAGLAGIPAEWRASREPLPS